MSVKTTFISYLATLTILFAGASFAGEQAKTEKMLKGQEAAMRDAPPAPAVKDPVPDMKKQEKTEKMLKGQKAALKDAPPAPAVKDPVPDMKKQEKTETMLKEQDAEAKEGL